MTHAEIFISVLIAHCFGDYWLQSTWMAKTKSKPGIDGHLACTAHASIYSLCVCIALSLGTAHPLTYGKALLVWLLVFVPHWLIDRYSLAALWMQWKNGVHPWKVWQVEDMHPISSFGVVEYQAMQIQKTWDVAFTAFVYIVSDNSLHLLCMWLLILKLL